MQKYRKVTNHRLKFVEPSFMVQEADRVSCHQSTQGVSDYAQLLHMYAFPLQLLQLGFDLCGNPLTTNFNAIVCGVPGIALWEEDMHGVLWELFAQGRC